MLFNPILTQAISSPSSSIRIAAWDILAALRGPDPSVALSDLKHRYTSKIRVWAIAEDKRAAMEGIVLVAPTVPTLEEFGALLSDIERDRLSSVGEFAGASHYLRHVEEAIRAIILLESAVKP